jgi:prophage tail gpP-like protein
MYMPGELSAVILNVNGREHADWTSYEIESDFLTPADAWRVSLGIPAGKTPDIKLWQPASVSMDGTTVLEGRIDRITRSTRKGERVLTLSGRDLAGILCDCTAPIVTARELSMPDLINLIVKPLGISKVEILAKDLREKADIEPGMKAWDALQRACELNGCHAWFAPDGTLIVGGPDYSAAPVGELLMDPESDTSNVISLQAEHAIEDWFSEITVLSQTHGTKKRKSAHDIKAKSASGGGVLVDSGAFRPLIVIDGDCDTPAFADKKAKKLASDAVLSALTITAEVRGHKAFTSGGSGPLWEPGQRVRVVSKPDALDDTYFLMGRAFLCDESGQRTRLTLKPDGVWLPDAPKKKAKGGKGSGGGRIV